MVKFYILYWYHKGKYVLQQYYLDRSKASGEALRMSARVPCNEHLTVQEVSLSPYDCSMNYVLRVDGLARSAPKR